MSGQVEDIKARIDIVDLVSEFVALKQAGTNWKGLCPFHGEKTPSFLVSRDKQIWHCFGCGEGGDIFTFLQKIEGLEFSEALSVLAKRAGVTLEQHNPKEQNQKDRLFGVCELAKNFWHHILTELPQGYVGRDYLKQRGVSEEAIARFKLGYAPESWELTANFLKKRGYSDQEIFLAGLSVKKDRGQGFYDRFRNRLIFPINDGHGRTVGFTGRTLDANETGAKYINTPQTQIYNKSAILFNLDQAKQAIKKADRAIVVEGQMDVVAAVQAGTSNVVAVSGTAFTPEQLGALKRFTANIAIAFDTDPAGESASKRGIDLALSQDMNVSIISLPQGKDPDECIKANPDDWFTALENTKSVLQYYFDQVKNSFDLSQATDKKKAGAILLNVIVKISNKIEQSHWLQELANLLQVPEQILRESLPANQPAVKPTSTAPGRPVRTPKARSQVVSEQLLAIVLKYPKQLPRLIERVTVEMVHPEPLQDLYKTVIVYYTESISSAIEHFDYSQFYQTIKSPNLAQLADTLVLLAEKDFFDFSDEAISAELLKLVTFLKKDHFSSQLQTLEQQIKQAEAQNQKEDVERLSQEVGEIIHQLNLLG